MKVFVLFLALIAAAQGARAADPIRVACFSTVVAEIAGEVGGDAVKVESLVSPEIDPHEYQPTPADLRAASEAKLILTSGKHLESYLSKLREITGGKTPVIGVGESVPTLRMSADHDHGGGEDPHWWQSVSNVERATKTVRDALVSVDAANAASYQANASAYLAQLGDLERWVKRKVAELPRDRRKLVTSHDAFQYFAHDYGFTIFAVEGLSTETEATNRHVSELIDAIKREGVKAVFTETTVNPKVTMEITRETGAKMGGALFADGLGTGDAETYAGMMKHNVSTIVDALK